MHGLPITVSNGAPLPFQPSSPVISETSKRAIERGIHYLAARLAPTIDRQDDLLSVGLRTIHYAHVLYEDSHGATIETFLIRCAHRAMLDFLRTERRQTGAWVSGDAPASPDGTETVFETLPCQDPATDPYQAMLLRQVEMALPQLPQRQRECIQMFKDGYTHAEIAVRLGVSRPRVTRLFDAGVRQLRGLLAFRTLTPVQYPN